MPEVAPPTLPPRQTLPSAQMQFQPPEVQMPPVGVPSQEEDPFATFLGLFTDREPKELVPIPLPPEKTGIDPQGDPNYRGLVPPVPEASAVSAPAVSVAPGGVAPEAALGQANGMVEAIDFTGDPEQIFSQMQAAVDFATANGIVVLGGIRYYYDANGERVAVPIIKFGQQGEWIQLDNAEDLSGLTPAGSLRADDDPGSTFILSGIGDFFDDLGDFRSVRPGSWLYNIKYNSGLGDLVGKIGDFFDMGGGFLNPFDERPPEVPIPVGAPGIGTPPGYSAAPTDGSMVPPVPKPLNPTDQGGQVFYPVVGSDWAGSQPMGEDAGSGYRYGDAPHGEASDYRHNAVDIQGAEGSGIASTVSGEVITIDFDPVSYGLHIRIRDAQGRVHLYAHLQSISPELQVGARVQGGQSIAAMGGVRVDQGGTYQLHSSITLGSDERLGPGRSTGSHLHYEVQDGQGNPIDPGTFLPGASPSSGASTAVSASNLDSPPQAQMAAKSQGSQGNLTNFLGADFAYTGPALTQPGQRRDLPQAQNIPSFFQNDQGFFGGQGGGKGQGPWIDPQGDPNYRPRPQQETGAQLLRFPPEARPPAQPGQDGFGSWLNEQRQRPGMESLLGPEAFPFRTQDRINNFQPTPWDTAARYITAAKRGLGYVVGGDMVGDLYTGYLEHVRRDPERAQAERDRGANPPPQGWIGEHIDAPIGEFARNAYEAITETPLSVFPYRGMAGRTSDTPAGPTLSDIGERMEWRDPEGNVAIGPLDIAFAALGAKPVLRAGAYQAGRAVGWADQVAARAAQAAGARRAAQARAAAPDAIPATRGAARLPEPYIEGEVTVLGEQRLLPRPAFAEPLRPPPPRTRQIPGRQAAAELQRPPPSGQAITPEPPPSAIPPTIPSAFPLMPVPPRGQIGLGKAMLGPAHYAAAGSTDGVPVLHAGPGESFGVVRDGILNAKQFHYPGMGAGTAIILLPDGTVVGAAEHAAAAQWILQHDPSLGSVRNIGTSLPGPWGATSTSSPVQYVQQRGGMRLRKWGDQYVVDVAPELGMTTPQEAGDFVSEQLAKAIAFSIQSAGGIEAVLAESGAAATISWEVSYGQNAYGVDAYEYPQGYDLNMGEVARTGINKPQWHIRVTPEMIAKHLPEVRGGLVRGRADLRPEGVASGRSVNLDMPPGSLYAAMLEPRHGFPPIPWHRAVANQPPGHRLRVERMRDALDAFMDEVRTSPNFDLKALNYLRDLRNGVQMGAVGRDLMGYQQIEDGVVRALFEGTTGGSRTEGRFGQHGYGLDLRNMTEKLRVAYWAMEKVNSVESFQSAWSHIQREAGINSKLARQNFSPIDALGREAELLFSILDLFVKDGLKLGEIINLMGGGSYEAEFALPIDRAIRQQSITLDPDTKPMQQLLLRQQPGYNYMRPGQENLDAIPNTEPLTPRDVMPQEIEYPPQGDFDQYQLDTRNPMPLDERRWSDVDAGESLMDPRSARVTEDYTRLVLKYRFLTTKDSGPRPRMSARSYSQSGLVARHRAGMSKAESAARDETLRQAMDHIKLAREYWAQDAIDAALSAHADAERLLRKLPEFVEIERLLSEADGLAELLSEASIDPNFDEIIGIDGAADLLERETDIFDEFLLTTEHAIFDRGVQSDNPGVHAALPADLAKLRRFHGVLERMYDRLMGRPPEEFMPGGGGAGGIMLPPQAAALSAAPVGASGMWS